MFKANRQMNEELDRAGRLVLLAAASNDEEVEAAATPPFLFTRVRAAIAEEQRRREEAGNWLSMLFVARRAVPTMALIAILTAVLTLLSAQPGTPANNVRFDDEALFDTRDTVVEQSVLADNGALSRDEVFSIVVDRNEQEKR